MKITEVETIPYRIPMRKPLRFASGEVHDIEHVLLRIRTDAGLVGCADIPPRPYTYGETLDSVIGVVGGIFAPASSAPIPSTVPGSMRHSAAPSATRRRREGSTSPSGTSSGRR